jgi:hypothetical protein
MTCGSGCGAADTLIAGSWQSYYTAAAISSNDANFITRTLNLPFGATRWESGDSLADFGFTIQWAVCDPILSASI